VGEVSKNEWLEYVREAKRLAERLRKGEKVRG
jgi:hypothetical protein